MPALGMAQETGKLLEWLKADGDTIAEGEPIMEIETDKVTVEIEATVSGTLAGLSAQPGDDVPVGTVVAWILAPGEQLSQEIASATPAVPTQAVTEPAVTTLSVAARAPLSAGDGIGATPVAARVAAEHGVSLADVPAQGAKISKADVLAYLDARKSNGDPQRSHLHPASPKARRLAQERGLEVALISGSGPSGAVLTADVLAAEALPALTAPSAPPVSTMWQVMVQRLSEAWGSVPHFYLARDVDASRLIDWRTNLKERTGAKITYTDLLVKLVTAALSQHPRVNASWRDDTFRYNDAINIGLAVAVDDGLIVPVIQDANTLGVPEIAARRAEIVTRARDRKLRPDDLAGGTFTISNLGMYGIDAFNAIVNPPQAAILAVGRIADRVIPVDGQPAVRPMLTLTLSFDHRVVDGARGAEFVDTLADLIEEPLGLIT